MKFYIKEIEDHHDYWKTTKIIVCGDECPDNLEEYQVVEADSIRDLI